MDRHIINTRAADLAQQHRDPVDVGFAADDAYVRVLRRLMHHMFAAAKTDLQPDGFAAKQRRQVQRCTVGVHIPIDRTGRQRL